MITHMYTVKDKLADEAGPIWIAKNRAVARRQFFQLISNERVDKVLDYELYELGIYNTESMLIAVHIEPEIVNLDGIENE